MSTPSRPARNRRTVLTLSIATGLGLGMCMLASAAASNSAPTPHSDSVGAAVSDTAITAKVKSTFLGDARLKHSHIHVTTTNGVVTLTGSALSSGSKSAAEELTKGVDGVKSVDDEITTGATNDSLHKAVAKAERVGSDSWITTKVKSEILSDSISKGFDIHVKTLHGVVLLRGTLPNDDAVAHVKDMAQGVEGVKSVDASELKSSAE